MEVKSEGSPHKHQLTKYIKFQRMSSHNNYYPPSSVTDSWPDSMIGRYMAVCREKHKLMDSWQRMRNRDQYAKRQQQLSEHKTLIENKKKQYLERYRYVRNDVGSKSREQNKSGKKQKYQTRVSTCSDNLLGKKVSEECRSRAMKIKIDQSFHQRFIEQRNKLEFDRKLMSAQDIKRHKKQLQNNLLKAKAAKHSQIARELATKIHRQLGQCNKLQRQVSVFKTSHSKPKQSSPQPSKLSNKCLFKRIL